MGNQAPNISSGQISRERYRPDIDGLRAVAIISVVGFHLGLPGFQGGFVGVDIFFVISGFLITTLLLKELNHRETINVFAFFARRARRLLPAFFCVAVITLLLGYIFLVPFDSEQNRLSESATAAAVYISNLYFARTGDGYFDPPSDFYPLLHTWSLAVGEQFYLVWPLILLGGTWCAARCAISRSKVIIVCLCCVLVASVAYSWWTSEGYAARAAFFVLPSRAWELGIGACLALALASAKGWRAWPSSLLTIAGLLGIGFAIANFDEKNSFPSFALLLPTLGAAAVIAGGSLASRAFSTRALSLRPLVAIGLVSYSWYLWHWPLLAIGRSYSLGTQDIWRDAAIAFVALCLAGVTYVCIEQPFRTRTIGTDWSNLKTIGAGLLASLLVIVAAQLLMLKSDSSAFSQPFFELVQAERDQGWSGEHCYQSSDTPYHGLLSQSACAKNMQTGKPVILIWGDSHADHLVGMFEIANADQRFALLARLQGLCPPILDVVPRAQKRPFTGCALFNQDVLAEAKQLHSRGDLAAVVLSAHWTLYLGRRPGVPLWANGRWLRNEAAANALAVGLRSTLEHLVSMGIRVLVVGPTVDQPFRVPACLARRSIEYCSVPRRVAEDNRTPAFDAIHKATHGLVGVHVWDPLPALCDDKLCADKRAGIVMYRDKDHLTYIGSRWLGAYFAQSSSWSAISSIRSEASMERPVQN